MILYLVSGYLDVAATSLADAKLLLAALADPATAANAATIARVTGKVESLVQSDSGEPLTISSIDDTSGTISSWVTDAGTTLAVGLGDPDTASADTYASTSSFSIGASSRSGTLALNTTALASALAAKISCQPRRTAAGFTLHIRKTTAGVTKSVLVMRVMVAAGVLSATLSDGVVTPSFSAGSVVPITSITSLTGGGTTALDGLVTVSGTTAIIPTGATVILSYGRVGQTWQLIAGTDAEDAANGVIRPDDYNASTNARIWVQL